MLSFFTLVDGSSGRLHLGSTAAVRGDSSTIDQHKSKHAALQALFREDLDVVMRREPQIAIASVASTTNNAPLRLVNHAA